MTTVTDSKMRSTSKVHAAIPISACKDPLCMPHRQGRSNSKTGYLSHRPLQRLVPIYALIQLVLITAFPVPLRANTLHPAESVPRSSAQSSFRSAIYEPRFSIDQNSVAQALDFFRPSNTLESQLRQGFSEGIAEVLQVGLSSAGIDIVRKETKQRLNQTSIDQLMHIIPPQTSTDGDFELLIRLDKYAQLVNGVCVAVMQQLSEVDSSVIRKHCLPYQYMVSMFE
jgi:RNA binding exosome subunit